jgi:hypothetical protein
MMVIRALRLGHRMLRSLWFSGQLLLLSVVKRRLCFIDLKI